MEHDTLEKRFHPFPFIRDVFMAFGIQTLFMAAILLIFPDEWFLEMLEHPDSYQVMKLGRAGIAADTILQFFFSSVGCCLLSCFFNFNRRFQKILVLWRRLFTLISIVIYYSVIIVAGKWFPTGNLLAWSCFFLLFGFFFTLSVALPLLKVHYENKKYEKILKDFQNRKAGKENEFY